MNKILIISGPTASGKTSLAFLLAKELNGELISADSRQVYRGMDIVAGKEINKEIKTWLLDAVNPDEEFNVSSFYDLGWDAIKDILQRGKVPIVVGGTGFYIKALLDGIGTMGVLPNWELRRELEKLTIAQMQDRLQKVNISRWEKMNESDRSNPRRLVRAIETAGKSEVRSQKSEVGDILWIGLSADFKTLYERIDKRVDERLVQGAVEETSQLGGKFGWDIPSMTGQGYRELRPYIQGEIDLQEAVRRWKFAEHMYARKQMTWFKKEKRIVWFDITALNVKEKVVENARAWYHKNKL